MMPESRQACPIYISKGLWARNRWEYQQLAAIMKILPPSQANCIRTIGA